MEPTTNGGNESLVRNIGQDLCNNRAGIRVTTDDAGDVGAYERSRRFILHGSSSLNTHK